MADNKPVRVGVLFSETGVTSVIERSQRNATLLAIEEVNAAGGAGGSPLEPVCHDPQSDPKRYGDLAKMLVAELSIPVLFGCYMSSTRKAVLPVVEEHRALLFYPTLYEGFEFSNHVIYTGAAPNQNSVQLCQFLLERYGNRFAFVGSNYIFPYESNRIMRDLLKQVGGEVVLEHTLPLQTEQEDFEPVVKQLVKKQPDVVFSTVVGQSTRSLYRAFRAAKLDSAVMPIASLTTSEAEVQAMGTEAAEGHITAAPYFASLDSPRNRAFVEAYRARFGEDDPVNHCAEAAYFQVHLFAKALAQAGSCRFDRLANALRGQGFEAPQGSVRIDPDNNHTHLWPRLGRVDNKGQFEILAESKSAIKPDPYLVTPRIDHWSMVFREKTSAA
ncbi:MAG: transporter substrate-binding domain-containing protein [Pseudomonadota bacterium]